MTNKQTIMIYSLALYLHTCSTTPLKLYAKGQIVHCTHRESETATLLKNARTRIRTCTYALLCHRKINQLGQKVWSAIYSSRFFTSFFFSGNREETISKLLLLKKVARSNETELEIKKLADETISKMQSLRPESERYFGIQLFSPVV